MTVGTTLLAFEAGGEALAIDAAAVLRTDEAVAGGVEDLVYDLHLAFAQRRDELLAFADRDTRIARAMCDQHRRANAVDAVDR